MKLIFKGKAFQVFGTIKALAKQHPAMTLGEYFSLCLANGGR